MTRARSPQPRWHAPSLSFACLLVLLAVLWVAGGASRPDVWGQAVVRAGAVGVLAVLAVFGPRPVVGAHRPILILLLAAILLVLLQLVPLPPSLWQSLPGRGMFGDAAVLSGQPQPWRPLAIVPGAGLNAAMALIVPLAVLIAAMGLDETERARLPSVLLIVVVASMLVGVVQIAGRGSSNMFVNESTDTVKGTFANRNHFAFLLALGAVLAPVWAFNEKRPAPWRIAAAVGLVIVFSLTILASGSRSGTALGLVGVLVGGGIVWNGIKRLSVKGPKWLPYAVVGVILAALLTMSLISVVLGRGSSIDRVMVNNVDYDMRTLGLPTVLAIMREYLPFGSGFGGFDTIFRIHEPFHLLKLTYFNHAHNDLLEVVLDGGVLGFCLLLAALIWWLVASIRTWRAPDEIGNALPKLGSGMLLLCIVASAVDYPARTPLIMAVIVLAGCLLAQGGVQTRERGLPNARKHL